MVTADLIKLSDMCLKFPFYLMHLHIHSRDLTSEAKSSTPDSTRLGEGHHTKLLSQLNVYASKWRPIGTYLGFSQEELELIHGNPRLVKQVPQSYLEEVFCRWYQWAPGDRRGSKDFATLKALRYAMNRSGLRRGAGQLEM